jgi:hypothetical protein
VLTILAFVAFVAIVRAEPWNEMGSVKERVLFPVSLLCSVVFVVGACKWAILLVMFIMQNVTAVGVWRLL